MYEGSSFLVVAPLYKGYLCNFMVLFGRVDIFQLHTHCPFFGLRRRVVQVYERGVRILDGSFRTQDLPFGAANAESGSGSESSMVVSVSIADPYVVLKMTDGSIRLLVGGISVKIFFLVYECYGNFIYLISNVVLVTLT